MGPLSPAARPSVEGAFRGVDRVGLDTAPIIYFVENNPAYFAVCEAIFRLIEDAKVTAVTSYLTLTETIVTTNEER